MIRVPGSSGRYSSQSWQATVKVFKVRGGSAWSVYERTFRVQAKLKRTAAKRIFDAAMKDYKGKLGVWTSIHITGVKRFRA